MCFAFTTTEQQLTARSYPSNDLTPPAMTMLVDRGSEKRTGIKSRRMPKAASQPRESGLSAAGLPASAGAAGISSSSGAGAPAHLTGGGAGASSSRPKGKGIKSHRKPKPSPKSVSKDAASLLADPRLKPTGHKSKVKPLPIH